MQRALLGSGELRCLEGEHGTADDGGFDHRAGVDADDGGTVKQRVEESGAVGFVDRVVAAARPHRHARHAGEDIGVPGPAVVGMRAHQHPEVSDARIAAGAQRLDPGAHEGHFHFRAGDEDRRTGEEDERTIVGQPHVPAERLPRLRRRPLEPAVERLGARDGDRTLGDAVVVDRFALLRLVPDGDHAGPNP